MPRPIPEIEADLAAAEEEEFNQLINAKVQNDVAAVLNQQVQIAIAQSNQHTLNAHAAKESGKHLQNELKSAVERHEIDVCLAEAAAEPAAQIGAGGTPRLFVTQLSDVMQRLRGEVTASRREIER